jgi:hypothetical protein
MLIKTENSKDAVDIVTERKKEELIDITASEVYEMGNPELCFVKRGDTSDLIYWVTNGSTRFTAPGEAVALVLLEGFTRKPKTRKGLEERIIHGQQLIPVWKFAEEYEPENCSAHERKEWLTRFAALIAREKPLLAAEQARRDHETQRRVAIAYGKPQPEPLAA